ncbi:uncharacterized protein LOC135937993 isoform X1 [Cloeon dipterum]|uniref:uncharacterized protein LOC135937993 isoform X1 n=1 Tax=Cloeon dipterum TaxID=197152 RepID=UPI00321FA9BC
MFALTVEKLSHYEYEEPKKGKNKSERKDLVSRTIDEQALCVNSDAPKAYRSPVMARRKLRMLQLSSSPRSASPLRASFSGKSPNVSGSGVKTELNSAKKSYAFVKSTPD